ncbi:MAG: ParA family protein [Rothia sp. (in: high G+C Gram-positive bacteria)]|uniref:ParA family protein n=1 Tax=Rothia sp. (in: high G+C Gram-positive bacteria) TaxID=1885016 RepID=UPI0026DED2A3|nr:ParA family protein [Rothia sp. (in: high G+C Gram-positive bacteria)]MDO5751048.1 ParA family protein [Rothia sp. (in: high G+C Gram-positive bacteria)]
MARIVSISSLKGGVGKTSLTLGLASAALHSGLKTLVIDLDPHADASTALAVDAESTDIAAMLVGRNNRALLDAVVPSGWNAQAGKPTLLTSRPVSGGEIMVARGSTRSALIDTQKALPFVARMRELIEATGNRYDVILIDCPPFQGTLTAMGWAASQRVLSVAEPSLFSVAGTERTLRAIAKMQDAADTNVEAAAVVMNKVRPQEPEHIYRCEEMRTLFGELVAEPMLYENPDFQRATGAAHPVHFWPDEGAVDISTRLTRLLAGLMAQVSDEEEPAKEAEVQQESADTAEVKDSQVEDSAS